MLQFKTIRYQNFLSTGNNFTEIELDKTDSTLVIGENGAGKSTMLDALSFVLYGKPYRNINKPLLVNSINNRHTLVEIEFITKNKNVLVRRGIKPSIFEIWVDDKLIEQSANVKEYQDYLEKNILKLNHKSFTQIVVIGSAGFTPFMQLRPMDRRSVIEDLLDIEIFSKMFTILKEKININRERISESRHTIKLLEEKIKLVRKHIDELVTIRNTDIENNKNRISQLLESIEDLKSQKKTIEKEMNQLKSTIVDNGEINKKISKLDSFKHQFQNKIKDLNKEIEFLNENNSCSTCGQEIDESFRELSTQNIMHKIANVEIGMEKLSVEYGKYTDRMKEINDVQNKVIELNDKIMSIGFQERTYLSTIEELKQKINVDKNTDTTKHTEELRKLKNELEKENEDHKKYINLADEYSIAAQLLKDDGIKSKIIKQYVPIINKLMNKYLAAMEFFVQFELDENFNEKIRSRFRDEFTYESFSEGEKARLDLCLLLTWRAIAKLRNSSSTNLLIMDEVFDGSLDTDGIEYLMSILKNNLANTNVFVISHKTDQMVDRFHRTLKFQKVKNFSIMHEG